MTLSRWRELYAGHFRVTLIRYMAYRVELVIWLISMILQPVVFLVVWQTAAGGLGGVLNGFTRTDLAGYFILAMLVNHLTMSWLMFEWDGRVRNGDLSYLLLRPHHVIHRDLGENITFKTATAPVMLLTAAGLTLFFGPTVQTDLTAALAFVPALLLAYALRFTSDWTAAMGALYTERVEAVNVVYFFVLLLFSGQMAPLPLLPETIQSVAAFLPFRWMIDFPVRLAMGRLTTPEIWTGLMAQAGWVAALTMIRLLVWSHGLKRYTAVGL